VEEELQMDTAESAPTLGLESTHPADPDLADAIALSMDTKRKSPQRRWQQEQEAMAKELQLVLDLSRRGATDVVLRV
jgi:hypothetical protein